MTSNDIDFSEITPEIYHLAGLCRENGSIAPQLYEQHQVNRGLRDLNGNGVLTGLTEISDIVSSKLVDGKKVSCEGKLYYRGIDIEDIVGRGLAAVMVGGTGLYVRAALDEFSFPAGAIDDDLRRSLEQRATAEGPEALHAELRALDPEAAARIHPNNVRRTVRALEMLAGGKRYSEQAEGFGRRRDHYPGTRYLGLTMERETLYRRVDERVDTMLSAGLLQEVRRLADAGYRQALTSMQAIGYKELLPVLDAELPLHEAVSQIKQATRRYAKRQLSWFRADPRIVWLDVTALSPSETLERAWRLVESSEHS
jgi:tRNA dimethylallyltransferase